MRETAVFLPSDKNECKDLGCLLHLLWCVIECFSTHKLTLTYIFQPGREKFVFNGLVTYNPFLNFPCFHHEGKLTCLMTEPPHSDNSQQRGLTLMLNVW